jgi:chromosome segregation ATPase
MSETPSHFRVVCPNCQLGLKVRYAYSGSYVRCKHCEHKFRALAPDDPTVSPSSAEYTALPLPPAGPEADRLTVTCPNCAVVLSIRRARAGHHVRCRSCQHKFLVENVVETPVATRPERAEGDVFDRLYRNLEEPDADEPPFPAAATPRAGAGELAELRAERDKLRDELAAIHEDHAHLRSDRDTVAAQLHEIQDEHHRLVLERDTDRKEHERLLAELASIRDALGDLPAGAVGELRKERDSLSGEIEKLNNQVEKLQAELSASAKLEEVIVQRERELQSTRDNAVRLEEQIKHLDESVNSSRAEREELDLRILGLDQELATARAGHEEVTSRLSKREEDLAAKCAEIERLVALNAGDEGRAPDLRGADTERASLLEQERDRARDEIDQVGRLLEEARQARHDDRLGLEAELSRARQQFESADLKRVELEARVSEFVDTLAGLKTTSENLKADHDTAAQREQELKAARQHAELLQKQVQDLDTAVTGSRAERDQLDRRVQHFDQELKASRALHEEVTRKLQEREDELAAKCDEIEKLLAARAEVEKRAEGLRGTLEERESELKRFQKQLESADAERAGLEGRVSELLGTLGETKVVHETAAQREQELKTARFQAEQLEQRLQHFDNEVSSSRAERDQLDRRVQELDQALSTSRTRHEEITNQLQESEDELAAKCDEIEKLLAARADLEEHAAELRGALTLREGELQRAEKRLVSTDAERAGHEARVNELLKTVESVKADHATAAQREQELKAARFHAEQLQKQVRQLDDAVTVSCAERDQLDRRVHELDEELATSRTGHEEISTKLQQREDELAAKCAEIEKLITVRAKVEGSAADLRSAVMKREEELKSTQDRLEAAASERTRLEARLSELSETMEMLEAGHREAVESERSRLTAGFESTLEAEKRGHAAKLAELEARSSENAQLVSRLKAEIGAIAQSRPAPDAELEAARLEIAELRRRLDETEISKRSMSSLLEGMGIRLH